MREASGRRERRALALAAALVAALTLTGGVLTAREAGAGLPALPVASLGRLPAGLAEARLPESGPVPQEEPLPRAGRATGVSALADPAWVARVSEAAGIPARALAAYAGADIEVRRESGCAVGWNTLAAIGYVESEHGTIHGGRIEADGVARPGIVGIPLDGQGVARIPDTDNGELDGDPVWDRAVGPMQFIPQTWEQWGADGSGDGVTDAHNIDDAALSAARYLCHAHGTLDGQDAWIGAIRSYNDSDDYQRRIAAAAEHYAVAAR